MAATDDSEGRARSPGLFARFGGAVSRVLQATADLVVPPLCLNCRKPLGSHDALCAACWRQIRFIRQPLCDRLGMPLPYDGGPDFAVTTSAPLVSAGALANPPDWDRVRAVAEFGPVIQDMVHAFKYADRHDARQLFGRWLVDAGADLLAAADLIVPVPLHRWRLIGRKFNQAAILSKEVSRLTGVPADMLALRRVKSTPAQVGLTVAERRRNLTGAFQVPPSARPRIEGRKLVLIDDVVTTGSTAGACARVLRRAGAVRVDVLALALVTPDSRIGN